MDVACPSCTMRISLDLSVAVENGHYSSVLCIQCGKYFDASGSIRAALYSAQEPAEPSAEEMAQKKKESLVALTPEAAVAELRRATTHVRHSPLSGPTPPPATAAPSSAEPSVDPSAETAPQLTPETPAPRTNARPLQEAPPSPPPPDAPETANAPTPSSETARSKRASSVRLPELKRGRNVPKTIGHYDVQDEVARGGMGIVYKAVDAKLRRTVAIKVLISGEGAKDEDIKRFQREAQATARLHHPNIVPIHAVGEHDGRPYFVMDFVDGQTAKDLKESGRMTPRLAMTILEGVAEGLHHAHEHGVVHRDVKPANIIVDSREHVQLMDFGLARRVDEDLEITQSGTTMGTPSYMAPEQAEGRLGDVDAKSDVYSAGACLYELLTGRPPFEAPTVMATLRKVLDEPPVPPRKLNPRIHRDVETICLKCLEKDKANRYSSARALAEDIRRFHRGEAIQAKPLGALARISRLAWRHREVTFALLAVLCFGVAALVYTLKESQRVAHDRQIERRQRYDEALETGRSALNRARQSVETLRGLQPADFENRIKAARTALSEAARGFQQAEAAGVDSDEPRQGLEQLKALENNVEVQRFIQRARQFLNPVPSRTGNSDEPPPLPNYAGAEFAAQEAVDRDPENREARELLRQALGVRTVKVEVLDGEAEVYARRMADSQGRLMLSDPTDLGKLLGTAPVKGVELEPGLYIVNLKPASGGLQQATLLVSRESRDEDLTLRMRANAPEENMVLLSAGSATIPQAGPQAVGMFAIDRFEYPNRAGVAPVTGLSQLEAQAQCRKRDKTVCTTAQWLRACMGDEERRYPYAKSYSARQCAVGFDGEAQTQPFVSGMFPRCRTPEGVYDMSGNVAEWTDSTQDESAYGGDWTSSTRFADLTVACWARTLPEQVPGEKLGFRCCKAKSQ